MKRYLLLLVIFVLTIWTFATYAATNTHRLRVGVIETAPFATINPANQEVTGIATSIWQIIADELHWKYKYISLNRDYHKGINMLANHQLDILIGLVPVDHEARRLASFSRPFTVSYSALLVNTSKMSIGKILKKLAPKFLYWALGVLAFFLLLAHISWWLEKKKHDPILGGTYPRGVFYSLWFMMTAIFTATFDVPCRPISRLNYFLATLLSSLFILSIAAIAVTLTSLLTLSLSQSEKFTNTGDIKGVSIAAITHSLDADLGRKYGANIILVSNLTEGINLLQQQKVDAILDNYHVLVTYLKKHPTTQIHISDLKVNPDELAFAFPQNSPLNLPFDIQLTLIQDMGQAEKICKEYLPNAAAEYCAL